MGWRETDRVLPACLTAHLSRSATPLTIFSQSLSANCVLHLWQNYFLFVYEIIIFIVRVLLTIIYRYHFVEQQV